MMESLPRSACASPDAEENGGTGGQGYCGYAGASACGGQSRCSLDCLIGGGM